MQQFAVWASELIILLCPLFLFRFPLGAQTRSKWGNIDTCPWWPSFASFSQAFLLPMPNNSKQVRSRTIYYFYLQEDVLWCLDPRPRELELELRCDLRDGGALSLRTFIQCIGFSSCSSWSERWPTFANTWVWYLGVGLQGVCFYIGCEQNACITNTSPKWRAFPHSWPWFGLTAPKTRTRQLLRVNIIFLENKTPGSPSFYSSGHKDIFHLESSSLKKNLFPHMMEKKKIQINPLKNSLAEF